jgi:hypothetical protein
MQGIGQTTQFTTAISDNTSRKMASNPTTMMCRGLIFSRSCWYSLP